MLHPAPGRTPREKQDRKGHGQPSVHCSTTNNGQDTGATYPPSTDECTEKTRARRPQWDITQPQKRMNKI